MTNSPPDPDAWSEVKERARLHGLDLSDADARDLQPFYDQHQRWLATLRRVLRGEEEPATRFAAGDARDDRE